MNFSEFVFIMTSSKESFVIDNLADLFHMINDSNEKEIN